MAELGAEKLWKLVSGTGYVHALGALTGNQAVQMVKAGLQAIYVSGWQVAADANLAGHMYPDQSLYPANSVPELVKRINGREKIEITRFKGLGEMMPKVLWETTLNPRTRRLLRVEIADQIRTDRVINELMGKDPSARFRFIMEHAEEAEELDV